MSVTSHRDIDAAHFDTLRAQLRGALALPGDTGYDLARPMNLAVTLEALGVVAAADVEDVRVAVRWAEEHGLRVAVHATGHGTVNHGDDTLVVHTGGLQECAIDADRRVARVGAGVPAHRLLDAAQAKGLTALVGSSATVGVVGYLSGGGVGPLVSTFGLSADYVRALEVVTGEGVLYRANADQNPDLYWALRGAKAAVGIITAIELDLLELPSVYVGALHFSASDCAAVMHTWASWSAQLPEIATTSLALTHVPDLPGVPAPLAGQQVVSVRFGTTAGRDEAEALLTDIRQTATPLLDGIGEMSYRELGAAFGDPDAPVPVHQDQALLTALPPAAVDAILEVAGPDAGAPLTVVELRRLGGALAREPLHGSMFSHRDSAYSLGVTGVLADLGAPVVATAERLLAAARPWVNEGIFANFVDTTEPMRLAQASDASTLARFREIAAAYDPKQIFSAAGELPRTISP